MDVQLFAAGDSASAPPETDGAVARLTRGGELAELVRLFNEIPAYKEAAEKQKRDLNARAQKMACSQVTESIRRFKESMPPITRPNRAFGIANSISESIKRLAPIPEASPFMKSIAAITEQHRRLDALMKPTRDLQRIAKLCEVGGFGKKLHRITAPQTADFAPLLDAAVFRDLKLEVAIETRAVIEDLRDVTGELVAKQELQIANLQGVNQHLVLANERAERALEEAREETQRSRNNAERERRTSRITNTAMLAVAILSMLLAGLAWLYPRSAPESKPSGQPTRAANRLRPSHPSTPVGKSAR